MRIMIVTDQYPPMIGGVPTVTRGLAVDFANRGHQVWVVAPSQVSRNVRRLEHKGSLAYILPFMLRYSHMSKILSRRALLRLATKVGITRLTLLLFGGIAWWLNILQVIIFLVAAVLRMRLSSSSKASPAAAASEWSKLQPPQAPLSQTTSHAVMTY